MDFTKENVNPNPMDETNPIGVLFFTYTIGMFKKGYQKTLEVVDLYNPIRSDRSRTLGDRLERAWNKLYEKSKRTKKKPRLLLALASAFWPEYFILSIYLFLFQISALLQTIMLGQLLAFFSTDSDMQEEDGFFYALGLSFFTLLGVILNNQFMMKGFHYGMKVRAASCALIYRKALRLNNSALGDTAPGKIVNLLSNDVSRFDLVSVLIHHIWLSPIFTLVITYLLYRDAGWAGVIGIASVLVIVPIQGYGGKLSAVYRKATAQKTDERVGLMDEILSGIQVIKMYAWEKPFAKLIRFARKAELGVITKLSWVRGIYMTFLLFTTRLALFTTAITVVLTDRPITASMIFTVSSYIGLVADSMATMFVRGISEIAELSVSIKRIEEFMLNEEYESLAHLPNNKEDISNKYVLSIQDLTAKWNIKAPEDTLKNITININRGELVGIIGPVGSGKSSLLQTLLGELKVISGEINVNGTISYASQEAWVFAATVRQNILFGSEYDKKRYQDVVKACALEKDFEQFSDGDLTVVGDRGSSLSGGQKARINLARAIYREADVYLLDDPLSAVDVQVSKHLYDRCVNRYLHNKTRILVTHQVHHLKNTEHIIILSNGHIEDEGTFKALSDSDNLYAKLLTTEPNTADEEKQGFEKFKMNVSSVSIPGAVLAEEDEEIEKEDDRLVDMTDLQEASSKGKVKGSLLLKYMCAGGNSLFVSIVLCLYVLAEVAAMGADYFISFWVKVEDYKSSLYRNVILQNSSYNVSEFLNSTSINSTETIEALNSTGYSFLTLNESKSSFILGAENWTRDCWVYTYTGLVLSIFILGLMRSILFYELAIKSSQKLHDSLFYSVINTSMRFFDRNPGGRILNRFSKDIGSVDELLPKAILDSGQNILMSVGSIVLISIVNPLFLIVVGIIFVISMFIRYIYLKTSKNIKRLEGVLRSPVFTHLNATLSGLTTVRAFNAQNLLRDEFDKHQDGHTSAWFMFIAASSAFGFFMETLCFILTSFITFSFLTFREQFGMSAGDVGLAITQCIYLTLIVQWGLRGSAEVTNQLMSVERVLEYTQLPREKQPGKPRDPPRNWPNRGQIKFEDMGLKYDENGDLILKHLNLTINPNEKVGIVGRTGAGKSSLISALFRLAHVEGTIQIDDINTQEISLEQLRSKISIIPQDPVLYSGTLRYNLDPFEEYNDETLYKAIEDVELKDPSNIINKLENAVIAKGVNYSVGQRQLICLARAILRNNKILMLDEATANVDPQTDALIQKTIRKKFADCTVLTVAHRLNTIMDSDRILVMDGGIAAEFDHPHILLQNPNSIFYRMVNEGGKAIADQLNKTARDSFMIQNKI